MYPPGPETALEHLWAETLQFTISASCPAPHHFALWPLQRDIKFYKCTCVGLTQDLFLWKCCYILQLKGESKSKNICKIHQCYFSKIMPTHICTCPAGRKRLQLAWLQPRAEKVFGASWNRQSHKEDTGLFESNFNLVKIPNEMFICRFVFSQLVCSLLSFHVIIWFHIHSFMQIHKGIA